jgi:hypothetical protein
VKESSLHKSLKEYYAIEGGIQEVAINGFLIDVVKNNILYEIQTRNFASLRIKLKTLLETNQIKIVYPIPLQKWIVRIPNINDGKATTRRKSPKHGRIEFLFNELVYISNLLIDPNLTVEVIFTHDEEIRRDDGKGSWRRKGASILDRRLVKIISIKEMIYPIDYNNLLPFNPFTIFTNQELAAELGIPIRLARKMTYSLRQMGILENVGKQKNSLLFMKIS